MVREVLPRSDFLKAANGNGGSNGVILSFLCLQPWTEVWLSQYRLQN